jgi:hypothetical protein
MFLSPGESRVDEAHMVQVRTDVKGFCALQHMNVDQVPGEWPETGSRIRIGSFKSALIPA